MHALRVSRAVPALALALMLSPLALIGGACGGGDPPLAPSMLTVTLVDGRPSLTWQDNSDDEIHFMVLRKDSATAPYGSIAEPPADATAYADTTAVPGGTYSYVVMAMNDAGSSP